jgi:hypothetical protein
MQPNLVLQATFASNQFPVANGPYAAVFSDPAAPSMGNSGLFNVTLSGTGTYSGKILQGTTTSHFSGKFDGFGHAQANVTAPNANLDMQINFGSVPRTIHGSLSNASFAVTFSAVATPYNGTHPATGLAGSYTASFTRSNAPATEGRGFGLISSAPNGTVIIGAPSSLPDGTKVGKPSVLTEDARSPLYIPLYGNTGMLVGWLNFSNGAAKNISADLTWLKPGVLTSAVSVVGSPY